jgi:hypothetical protein
MSNLFTAVSVEQQEIVAGGLLDDNSNNNSNGAIVVVKDSNFVRIRIEQINRIRSRRTVLA